MMPTLEEMRLPIDVLPGDPGRSDLWPILIRKGEAIGMKQAEDMTGHSAKTIKRWCLELGIGTHSCPSAPWRISAPALMMVLHGDARALELLRQGKRDHPRVSRFFDELGIPL
jgi:hypothetical protein